MQDLENVLGESGETLECAELDLVIRLPGSTERRSRSVLATELVSLFSACSALEKFEIDLAARKEGGEGRMKAIGVLMRSWKGEVVVRVEREFLERGRERVWEGRERRCRKGSEIGRAHV